MNALNWGEQQFMSLESQVEKIDAPDKLEDLPAWWFEEYPELTVDDLKILITKKSKALFERGVDGQGYLIIGEVCIKKGKKKKGMIKIHLVPAFDIKSSKDKNVKGIGDRPEKFIKPKKPVKNQFKNDIAFQKSLAEYELTLEKWNIHKKKDKDWMEKFEEWSKKPNNFLDRHGIPFGEDEHVAIGDANVKQNSGIGHKRVVRIVIPEHLRGKKNLIGLGLWKKGDYRDRSFSQNAKCVVWNDAFLKQYIDNGLTIYGIANKKALDYQIAQKNIQLPAFIVCADPSSSYIIRENKEFQGGIEIILGETRTDSRIIKRINNYHQNLPNQEKNNLIHYNVFSNLTTMVKFSDQVIKELKLPPFKNLSKAQQAIKEEIIFNRARCLPWALSENILVQLRKDLPKQDADDELIFDNRTITLTSPLFEAVKDGDLENVIKWIDKGCSPNEIGCTKEDFEDDPSSDTLRKRGKSLFKIAAKNKRIEVMKYLYHHPKFDKATANLLLATQAESVEFVNFLLQKKADITTTDKRGWTALHLAAKLGNNEIAELLLKNKANISAVDKKGRMALHLAAKNENPKFVELLLSKMGVNIDDTDIDDETALHCAARKGHLNNMAILLKNNITINKANKRGVTALHLAARSKDPMLVELLLDNKADIAATDEDGETALHFAVANDNFKTLKMLLDKRRDNIAVINAKDEDEETILHSAIKRGNKEIVDLLLKNKADISATDKRGRTALHLAAKDADLDLVKLLIENYANMEVTDSAGETVLHSAVRGGNLSVIKLLLNAGIDAKNNKGETALHLAVKQGNKKVVELLLQNKADLAATDENKETPLHFAVKKGHLNIIETLLEENSENINAPNDEEETALHLAAEINDQAIIKLLLENKADIAAKDEEGETSLHVAIRHGHLDIVKILIEKNADVNAFDENRNTPLHFAARYGYTEIAEYLLQNKANISAANIDGQTPLQIAKIRNHDHLIKVLQPQSSVLEQEEVGSVGKSLVFSKFEPEPDAKSRVAEIENEWQEIVEEINSIYNKDFMLNYQNWDNYSKELIKKLNSLGLDKNDRKGIKQVMEIISFYKLGSNYHQLNVKLKELIEKLDKIEQVKIESRGMPEP